MAPALSTFTWSFRDQVSGWTESWFFPGTFSQQQAVTIANSYLDLRLPLMGLGISSNFVRYRELLGTGLSYKFSLPRLVVAAGNTVTGADGKTNNFIKPVTPIYPGFPDRPYSCLMLTVTAAGQPPKRIFLSGIPDNVIIDPNGPFFYPGYLEQLNQLINYISTIGGGWTSVGGLGGNTKYPIISVSPTNGTVTTAAANFPLGTRVGVYGFRGLKGYRGKFNVVSSASGVVTLSGYAPPTALANPPKSFLRQVGTTFVPCPNSISGFAEVSHRRGKGLGVPVGRRKARSN